MFCYRKDLSDLAQRHTKNFLSHFDIETQTIEFEKDGLVKTVVLNGVVYKVKNSEILRNQVVDRAKTAIKKLSKNKLVLDPRIIFTPIGWYPAKANTLH